MSTFHCARNASRLAQHKKREKLTLVLKRDVAVFVIRNVHHSKFKLCNSNLEDPSAILLLPFIRPNSDEKKSFFIDFPAGGVGGGSKMKEISSNESDFESEKQSRHEC